MTDAEIIVAGRQASLQIVDNANWQEGLNHSDPQLAELRACIDLAERAIRERDRYAEREAHFAKVLRVADGGQYRADWDGPLVNLQKKAGTLATALEGLSECATSAAISLEWAVATVEPSAAKEDARRLHGALADAVIAARAALEAWRMP